MGMNDLIANLSTPQLHNLRQMAKEVGRQEIVTKIDTEIDAREHEDKKVVIVRSSGSGVWYGFLTFHDHGTRTVILKNARKVHAWSGAAATSGLAAQGPTDGRICSPVNCIVHDVLEVIDCSAEAVRRFAEVPAWIA